MKVYVIDDQFVIHLEGSLKESAHLVLDINNSGALVRPTLKMDGESMHNLFRGLLKYASVDGFDDPDHGMERFRNEGVKQLLDLVEGLLRARHERGEHRLDFLGERRLAMARALIRAGDEVDMHMHS